MHGQVVKEILYEQTSDDSKDPISFATGARRVECLRLCNLSHHLISHLGLLGLLLFGLVTPVPAQERVSFNRDIRPILSDRCFICHGPDALASEADLRFDQEDSAKSPRGGGPHAAIVPGDPESSEMLVRMLESDPDLQIPPDSIFQSPIGNPIG